MRQAHAMIIKVSVVIIDGVCWEQNGGMLTTGRTDLELYAFGVL